MLQTFIELFVGLPCMSILSISSAFMSLANDLFRWRDLSICVSTSNLKAIILASKASQICLTATQQNYIKKKTEDFLYHRIRDNYPLQIKQIKTTHDVMCSPVFPLVPFVHKGKIILHICWCSYCGRKSLQNQNTI